MITLYVWDELGYYETTVEVEEAAPLPPRSTPTALPKLKATEVVQWQGEWVKVKKSVIAAQDKLNVELAALVAKEDASHDDA